MSIVVARRRRVICLENAAVSPVVVSAPTLTGTGVVGDALTLDPGVWSGVPYPLVSWTWTKNGVPLHDVDGLTFTPGPLDAGALIAATVTAANSAGTVVVDVGPIAIAEVWGRIYVTQDGEIVTLNGDPVYMDVIVPDGAEVVTIDGEPVLHLWRPVYVFSE